MPCVRMFTNMVIIFGIGNFWIAHRLLIADQTHIGFEYDLKDGPFFMGMQFANDASFQSNAKNEKRRATIIIL